MDVAAECDRPWERLAKCYSRYSEVRSEGCCRHDVAGRQVAARVRPPDRRELCAGQADEALLGQPWPLSRQVRDPVIADREIHELWW